MLTNSLVAIRFATQDVYVQPCREYDSRVADACAGAIGTGTALLDCNPAGNECGQDRSRAQQQWSVNTVDMSSSWGALSAFPAYVRAMSLLDDFERMRVYREKAADFQRLADDAPIPSVQRRYRVIARHYSELADREEQADKARMAERLARLKRERERAEQKLPSIGLIAAE